MKAKKIIGGALMGLLMLALVSPLAFSIISDLTKKGIPGDVAFFASIGFFSLTIGGCVMAVFLMWVALELMVD